MPSIATAVAKKIVDGLKQRADPHAAVQGQTFFKQPVKLLGVSAAAMRSLARDLHGGCEEAKPSDAVQVCERLLRDQRLEVKQTALLFLARFVKQLDGQIFTQAQRWIEAGWCDSWAAIDELCIDTLGPLLVRHPPWFRHIRLWHGSSKMWLRRAAMVALVKPVRRGLLLDEAYASATGILDDDEDLVQKAVGWLLREAGKTDMERLQAYLTKVGSRCARTSLRYALERFPEAVRRRLLIDTKPIRGSAVRG